jgi:hypothetical protein
MFKLDSHFIESIITFESPGTIILFRDRLASRNKRPHQPNSSSFILA